MTGSSECACGVSWDGSLALWAIICYGGMSIYEDESVPLLSRVGALVVREDLLIIVCIRDTVKNVSLERLYYHYY